MLGAPLDPFAVLELTSTEGVTIGLPCLMALALSSFHLLESEVVEGAYPELRVEGPLEVDVFDELVDLLPSLQ